MNGKKFDAAALGKLLIGFTENGLSGQGNALFEANPGGAPCNVLGMLKKLAPCIRDHARAFKPEDLPPAPACAARYASS